LLSRLSPKPTARCLSAFIDGFVDKGSNVLLSGVTRSKGDDDSFVLYIEVALNDHISKVKLASRRDFRDRSSLRPTDVLIEDSGEVPGWPT